MSERLADLNQPLDAISLDELQEQADEVDYLTPREFAKLVGVFPQQVYQWIRKDVLVPERCQCGRTVVRVSKSKAALAARARIRGQQLDTRSDPAGEPGQGDVVQRLPQADQVQRN